MLMIVTIMIIMIIMIIIMIIMIIMITIITYPGLAQPTCPWWRGAAGPCKAITFSTKTA